MAVRNQIRQKLLAGKAVGVVSGAHNNDLVDFLGQFAPDGIWGEGEHGPIDWDAIGDFSRACDLWNVASIVRVSANEPWLITRTLDRGASGIVIPHVCTRTAAEKVVEYAKFAPIGLRGMYGGRRSYGETDYFRTANDETLVVVLIEEIEAIRNLTEILKVDNIDVFFVAPSDLAQTMGHIGNTGHPEVQSTIDRALKQIHDAGRTSGTLVSDENRDRYLEMGVKFTMTAWQSWLAAGTKSYMAAIARAND
jgi:4-hydroxy-2-oxoheptanedioate aldolase